MGKAGQKIEEFRWTAQTHAGRVRFKNEDAFLAITFDEREVRYLGKEGELPTCGNNFIFAVSDGISGAAEGKFASQTVLRTVMDLVSFTFHRQVKDIPKDRESILREFCWKIHDEVIRLSLGYEDVRNMGATLSLGWIAQETMHFVHVGDSRIYHLPKAGGLNQLTDDHTQPGELRRLGKITEREARFHPMRNNLRMSIGSDRRRIDPQVGVVPIESGDTLMFCSDGIIDGVWDKGIKKLIRTPPPYLKDFPPAQRLVKEALDSSGQDNLTAIVVEAH